MKLALDYPFPGELRRLLSLVGLSGLAAFAVVAAVMLLRRAVTPIEITSPWLLLGCGCFALLLVMVLREVASAACNEHDRRHRSIAVLAGAALLLSLAALSIPPTSAAAAVVLWIMVLAEESLYWLKPWSGRSIARFWPMIAIHSPIAALEKPVEPTAIHQTVHDAVEESESEELLPADVTQQLTRSRTEAGGESIYGMLRAEFTLGERQQWLNVAFCPPLATRPQCTAHFADGASGLLEVEEVETYGVRLMVRLPRPAEIAANVLVELFVESAAAADR